MLLNSIVLIFLPYQKNFLQCSIYTALTYSKLVILYFGGILASKMLFNISFIIYSTHASSVTKNENVRNLFSSIMILLIL